MQKQYSPVYIVLLILAALLQSTVLLPFQIQNTRPDFVLLLLIFFAHQLGSFQGMTMGFAAGLVMDLIGLSPLGFHSFIYTAAGYFFGATRGKVYVDALTLPVLLALLASAIKFILSFILTAVFEPVRLGALFTVSTLIEFGMNALISPFLYAVLRLLKLTREHDSRML